MASEKDTTKLLVPPFSRKDIEKIVTEGLEEGIIPLPEEVATEDEVREIANSAIQASQEILDNVVCTYDSVAEL